MKIRKSENLVDIFAINLFFLVAISISPWYSYDSFNIPKITLLVMFGAIGSIQILANFKFAFLFKNNAIKVISIFSILSFLITLIKSNAPMVQQIYGREGRSNGLLAYVSLIIIFVYFSNFELKNVSIKLNKRIALSGIIILSYSYLQLVGVDPFKWKTPNLQMFSTLGNPNFLSSFAGLVLVPFLLILFQICSDKNKLLRNILCSFIFTAVFFLIFMSKSYQGFFVAFCCLLSILIIYTLKFNHKNIFISALLVTIFGFIFSFAGVLNKGPLAGILYKASVTSRGDFFRSGFEMGKSNWISGVGIDSFGDYYLAFRDVTAANRLNGEFTDSAHNYFIDIFANFGVIFLLLYLSITLITLIKFIQIIKQENFNLNIATLFAVWLGLQLQSLISPTNLVFNILIFSISGLVIGSKKLENKSATQGNNYRSVTVPFVIGLSVTALIMLPIIQRDHAILNAYNGNSAENVVRAMDRFPKSINSYNRTLLILNKSGLTQLEIQMAREAINFNPRSSLPHLIILKSPLSTKDEKLQSYNRLLMLDPNNSYIRELKP